MPAAIKMPAEVTQTVGLVNDKATLDVLMTKVSEAQEAFKLLDQVQVDKAFQAAATAASRARLRLARLAVKEGGIGIMEDKAIKNHVASESVYTQYKDTKTVGVVERDESGGFVKVAEPIGVLAGVVPCTNPTSTTIFKSLLALKTRNCIVFSPHPRTARCTIEAAKVVRDAAIQAGAPKDCIAWIDEPTVELCNELMRHEKSIMIVATGAGGLVKAAYSCGKPAMGGGAGNTPVIIDETADIPQAVSSVLLSKTFDNGVICASEQSIIAVEDVADKVREECRKRGAYFLTSEEKRIMGDFIINEKGMLNPNAVGQTAWNLAKLAGIEGAPKGVKLLLAELDVVGPEEKLSHEKLCPCMGFYVVKDFDAALQRALELVKYGGMGHTSVLYTDLDGPLKRQRVSAFYSLMPTGRNLICVPTSQGAISGMFNFHQATSLSLGCGSWGSNATAEGLQVKHLLNYKAVTERREHALWFKVPRAVFFNRGTTRQAISELRKDGLMKAFIVTSQSSRSLGHYQRLVDSLEEVGMDCDVFSDVKKAPDVANVMQGVKAMKSFYPDVIIALGGGSTIDAAKVMRVVYEHPEIDLDLLYTTFLDINEKVASFPKLGSKVKKLVCIPTTSGTGAEMTPFALIMDKSPSNPSILVKRPIADYALTPDMAVIDADYVLSMPSHLAASTGYEVICHALESSVSMLSTDYTRGLALKAIRMIFEHLANSVNKGDAKAREACHNAASIGGMAYSNSFLGICNSLANQLNAFFKVPHGLASAMVVCQVVKYNAEDAPTKMGTFPQYSFPKAKEQYAEIADAMGVTSGCTTLDEKVDALVEKMQALKDAVKIPRSLKEYGIAEDEFLLQLEEMAVLAFDDQCTSSNPRYPLITELQMILKNAYHGVAKAMPMDMSAEE